MFNTAKDVTCWLIQLIVRLSAEQHKKARRPLPGKIGASGRRGIATGEPFPSEGFSKHVPP